MVQTYQRNAATAANPRRSRRGGWEDRTDAQPIDPSAIPGDNLRPDMVDIAAGEIKTIGDDVVIKVASSSALATARASLRGT
jgi:hypothetical protein